MAVGSSGTSVDELAAAFKAFRRVVSLMRLGRASASASSRRARFVRFRTSSAFTTWERGCGMAGVKLALGST